MITGDGEVTAFDPGKPFRTRDGREVQKAVHDAGLIAGLVDGHAVLWPLTGKHEVSGSLDLVNVPPTTSRDDPGDGESEAAFVERMDRTMRPDRMPEDDVRLRALARRAVTTNAEPVDIFERAHLESMTREWFAGPKPDVDGYLVVLRKRLNRLAHPPRDPEPEGDGWRAAWREAITIVATCDLLREDEQSGLIDAFARKHNAPPAPTLKQEGGR